MKRVVSVLFLFVFICTATEVLELTKLPMLYCHFLEHKNGDSKITFIEFLNIHYAHGVVFDEDYAKDMKLPFKDSNNINDQVLQNYVATQHPVLLELQNSNFNEKDLQVSNDLETLSTFCSYIWQPPKAC